MIWYFRKFYLSFKRYTMRTRNYDKMIFKESYIRSNIKSILTREKVKIIFI